MNQSQLTKTLLSVTAAGAVFFASSAFAQPMNSIADSWHNLGSSQATNTKTVTPNGRAGRNQSTGTAEVCVFCHTPHGGDNSAAVPIWNRKLNLPTAYARYGDLGSSTFDAQEAPIGSVTIACLSCHDGGQAIDSLINAPGSGRFTDRSQFLYGDMPTLTGNNTSSTMIGGDVDSTTGRLLPPSGATPVVQNLEMDLSNDHPVSMQYAGGGITGVGGALDLTTTRDPDFANTANHPGQTTQLGANVTVVLRAGPSSNTKVDTLFWLERSDSLDATGRDREDIIFYTRRDLGAIEPFVECGSCHDPHNIANPTFLRTSNGVPSGTTAATDYPAAVNDAASGLCLTCHVK